MSQPPLTLRKNEDRRLRFGHAWVYANEIDTAATPLKGLNPGELVELRDHRGRPLGLAFVDPHALICARLVSRDTDERIDTAFFLGRLRRALALRERLFAAPYYRLAYGDSDELPGIVIDRFDGYLVIQLTIPGTQARAAEITAALVELLAPAGVLAQTPRGSAADDDDAPNARLLHGTVPDELTVEEHGVRFACSALAGQKTGWFYDHRPGRRRLAELANGQRVLDVFSYVGAWGVQAAAAGAAAVTCIDASAPALEQVRRNAAANDVGDRVTTRQGDAFDVMRELAQAGERFDIVVLDPPAFIKRRKDQAAGETAYRRLNGLAMALLAPDGLLFSASCSLHLEPGRLLEIVAGAAHKSGRTLQLLEMLGQGPDHPVHPAIAETRYLKTLLCRAWEMGSRS
jgi:23S rRNA (cytosine1962-C5)-methyltransferase